MADFKERVRCKKVLLGCLITYPCPGIVELLRNEWDWFWIDCQHGELDYRDMLDLVRACDLVGCGSMIRVPSQEQNWIGRALDTSCSGIIVPQVENAAQAEQVVRYTKFPPLGNRSCGGRRAIDMLGRGYVSSANDETILMVQLESPEAINNAEEIASVEGIDCLLIGPNDVKLRLGYTVNEQRPEGEEMAEIEALVGICQKYGKISAAFGVVEQQLEQCLNYGVNLIANGIDARFIAEGSKRLSDKSREIITNHSD
jgi:2-keto-3-deoxy-L-rhamnonate aldolase RhmA